MTDGVCMQSLDWYAWCFHSVQLGTGSTTYTPVNAPSRRLQGMERRVHYWRTSYLCWRLHGAAARCWPVKQQRQMLSQHLQTRRPLVLSSQPGC
jgi:hypothetical protein